MASKNKDLIKKKYCFKPYFDSSLDEKQLFFQHTARKVLNDIQDKVFNDPHDQQICNGIY